MKRLPEEALPGPALKMALLARAQRAFGDAGYRQIGMDHFALPEDELGRALEARDAAPQLHGLHRAVGARHGRGGRLGHRRRPGHARPEHQEAHRVPTRRSTPAASPPSAATSSTKTTRLRRHVITELMCNGHLDVREVERRFGVAFAEYFAAELAELAAPGAPAADGLVRVGRRRPRRDAGRADVRPQRLHGVRSLPARARPSGATPVFSRTV